MDSPHDALDEAGHRDGYVFSELPIQYPKLIVDLIISGPLQDKKIEAQKTLTTDYILGPPFARVSQRKGGKGRTFILIRMF